MDWLTNGLEKMFGGNSGIKINPGKGDFWSGIGNTFTGNLDWERQQQLQNQQMDYNTEMSNTAVQRRIEDLKKAGINPILAGMNQAASAPTQGGGSAGHVDGLAAIGAILGTVAKLLK